MFVVESAESIKRYNEGVWRYTDGFHIKRLCGSTYTVINQDGLRMTEGGLGHCHWWLTDRDHWPVV